jgi:3-methyladenine DNA glycosylase/8-oxoguanine DNA glycosylase
MKKFLLHRIREGEFNPSPTIQQTIDSLNKSYTRAKETVERMHGNDEITLEESMTREFRYYSTEMQRAKQKQFEDEQKKMFELRKELKSIFEVDVWDEVIQNCEFDTLEEFYESYKQYVRNNYEHSQIAG